MHDDFARIEEAIQALKDGRTIIVVDDEKRENEGDFVAAADRVTPETVAFMITHGRGQLCMPIQPEVASRLELGPMVDRNTAPHQTPFTVPVDHVSCRTGISAEERARTVRGDASIRPRGPRTSCVPATSCSRLVAKEGWRAPPRPEHTEATVDLRPPGRPDARRDPVRDLYRRHPDGRTARTALHTRSAASTGCRSSQSRA